MNWKRAKNYTILFLLLLNVFLLLCNLNESKKYHLTSKNIETITTLLEQNKIHVQCEIPRTFGAKKQLSMTPLEYDNVTLQKVFFPGTTDVKQTNEFDKIIFKATEGTLTIENNALLYTSKTTDPSFDYQRESVIAACDSYIAQLAGVLGEMTPNTVTTDDDHYTVTYIGKFGHEKIFNSYALFTITKTGVATIEIKFSHPLEFVGQKSPICSASDALFTFMAEIRKFYDETSDIEIRQLDFGYYNDSDNTSAFNNVPCYHIVAYFDGEPDEFYVNAYNNTMFYTTKQ